MEKIKQKNNFANIADWLRNWDHFNIDLYIRFLKIRENNGNY